jgi:hypothetical protein
VDGTADGGAEHAPGQVHVQGVEGLEIEAQVQVIKQPAALQN